MPRIKPVEVEEEREKPADDSFVMTLQNELEDMMKRRDLEPKDRNALFANAIKFLAVRNKVGGGENEGWWGD
jgi:hypothetical protein